MTVFSDGTSSAALTYDDLGRNLSFTDTQGNAVIYEYDSMGRVSKVTPTQGVNYRTEYSYNKNGSLSQVTTYDGGTGADTDYSYNTTSGKLSYRDFPEESSQKIRTAYAYSYSSYHRQVVRTEQTPFLVKRETFHANRDLALTQT